MIAVCLTARASYARIRTVLESLDARGTSYVVLASGGAILRNFGRVVDDVRACHRGAVYELPTVLDGSTLETGALSTAATVEAYSRAFAMIQPQVVVVVADRREVLGCAISARYQNVPLLHLLGGERSGSVDDRVRDAITALADYHAVPHEDAAVRVRALRSMADDDPRVRVTGCPSVDLVQRSQQTAQLEDFGGIGPVFSLTQPFDVLLLHPDLNYPDDGPWYAESALRSSTVPMLVIWPGEDPGSEDIAKVYRQMSQAHPERPWHFVRQIPAERFYQVLRQARRLIGNSSVGVREATAIRSLEIVNLGHRQDGRTSLDYGDGHAGERVAAWMEALCADADSGTSRIRASASEEFSAVS